MKTPVRATLLAAALIASAAVPFTANALALINTALTPAGIQTFQDTDAERILRGGQVITSGDFQVGDIIETVLLFDTVNGTQIGFIPGLAAPYQLTAYAQLQIAAIVDPNDTTLACTTANCLLVFAPSGNLGTNVFAAIYENTGVLADAAFMSQTPGTAISQVTSQSLIATIGLGEADDFWASGSLLDIGLAAALAPGDPQVAQGVFGLSFLSNPGGLPYTANGLVGFDGNFHDIVGNASAYQRETGVNAGWLVSSNLSASFLRTVPEPTSIALMSLGLIAVSGFARRRRS